MAFADIYFSSQIHVDQPTKIFVSAKFANCTGFLEILKFAPFENYHLYGTRIFLQLLF